MEPVPAEWLALDLYAELGVPRTASSDQVRAAYRDLAPRFHPDHHPGDPLAEDRFRRIAAAYRVLGDPMARATYDRHHLAGPRVIPVRPAPAHRIRDAVRRPARPAPARSSGTDAGAPEERPDPPSPPPPRDETSSLAGLAIVVVVGAILLLAAIAIAVFVIGPDCDPGELRRLGCPPAP